MNPRQILRKIPSSCRWHSVQAWATPRAKRSAFSHRRFTGAYRRDSRLVVGTIYGHLGTAIEAGEAIDLAQLLTAEAQAEIAAAFKRTGWGNIVGARELLGEKYDYGLLRIFRAAANARRV